MVQHMVLTMLAPVFLALGAPITLWLRTLPPAPRAQLLAVLHSRVARVLMFFPVAFVLYIVSPWALYFSGWYEATLRSPVLHDLTHLHFVVIGCLFFWPLIGLDPVPGRMSHGFRVLGTFATLPFHAFLGVAIMGASTLIAGRLVPQSGTRLAPVGRRRPAAGRCPAVGGRRPAGAAVLRGAVRAVGTRLAAGGGARGPAARPARGHRAVAGRGPGTAR